MRDLFLGKPVHWTIIAALVLGGWLTGRARLHVIEFNLFILGLVALTAAALVAVLATSRPDERITRDPLEPDDDG